MIRRKIKGSSSQLRRPLPQEEPNFYAESVGIHTAYHEQHTLEQQHAVSPLPGSVSYESNLEASLFQCEVSLDNNDEHVAPTDVAFFEGSPFHFVEEDNATILPTPIATTADAPCPLIDPVAELAKIRERIRQKQEEYEQKIGHRPPPVRSVSLEQPRSNIPLYKGSYIAV